MSRKGSPARRPWCLTITLFIIVVIIVVIVVPCAVLIPKHHHTKGEKSTILFPLYIYPTDNSTWDPLFAA